MRVPMLDAVHVRAPGSASETLNSDAAVSLKLLDRADDGPPAAAGGAGDGVLAVPAAFASEVGSFEPGEDALLGVHATSSSVPNDSLPQ
jgi:hypothetical protein